MKNIFENTKNLISETLNKLILTEDEDKFVSVIDNNKFDSSKLNANIYDTKDNIDPDKEEEKNKLTSQAIEKIKQNLKVSDELQSILNRIDKLNKDIKSNDWQVNEEKNTAILRSKNARIFKQNNNLCLSHNDKVEIFKSVPELHAWLKKNNYPLPKNIKLHESKDNNPYILLGKICQHSDENSWIQKKALELANGFEHNEIDYNTFYNRLNDLIMLNNFNINEAVLTEEDEIPDENAPIYDFVNDDSELSRLKNRYKDTRWAQIIGKRWGDLGKVIDVMTPEERAEQQRQDSWANTYNSINKMSREQEKDARRMNDIKLVKNIFGDGPNMVYNDLHSYMGQFANNEKAYKDAIEQLKQNKAEKNKENTDKEQTKTEAFDDNQLDNDEVWYLEYQTNIPGETSYLNKAWREADLLSDNLDQAAKFISRDNAMTELQELYASKQTSFPFKPIIGGAFEECGACATTNASLGSAVQYVSNKKKEESFDEEKLTEDQRLDVKDRSKLNKELIKIANIKDFAGNVIGKAGKTFQEYADNNELGFNYDENGNIIFNQNDKTLRVADELANRRIALDYVTNQPIGMIDTIGKVRDLHGKQIGYSDTREAAKNRGIDLDKLDIISTHDDNWQYTQKAGSHWRNDANAIKFMDKEGNIRDKYADAWQTIAKDNKKLRDNPELLQTMFGGYFEKGQILDPKSFKQRVLEINDTFGLELNPDEPMIPSQMKAGGKQQQEFYKWRDNYYKPLFNASRRKNKAADKINADRENFSKEQDEWRASANDRAEQEQSIQYFINDMQDANKQFMDGKISGKDLKNKFMSIASNDAIPTYIKSKLAKDTYNAFASYDEDMADMWKELNNQYFTQQESVLTEDDSPADFADGPISSNMTGTISTTDQTIDQTDTISDGIDDYGLEEPNMSGGASFGDININAGPGENDEAPIQSTENKRIIDVLVNENDPSQIKLKIKDMDTNKIELKDLSEIDV